MLTSRLLLQLTVQVHEWALLTFRQETVQGALQLREGCSLVWVHVPAAVCHHTVPVADRQMAQESMERCKENGNMHTIPLTAQDHSRLASSACYQWKWPLQHLNYSSGGRAFGLLRDQQYKGHHLHQTHMQWIHISMHKAGFTHNRGPLLFALVGVGTVSWECPY